MTERFAPKDLIRVPRASKEAGLSVLGGRQIFRRHGMTLMVDGVEYVRRTDVARIKKAYALTRTGHRTSHQDHQDHQEAASP